MILNFFWMKKLFFFCYRVSSIESKSSHPMATALVEYAKSKSIQPKPETVTEFHIYPGEGIYGEISGRHIYIGNRRIMARSSCYIGERTETIGCLLTPNKFQEMNLHNSELVNSTLLHACAQSRKWMIEKARRSAM